MLRSLTIRDFVIVDRLELEFAPGFTVLTGETGAGKSILIDALAMVLGERADAIVVRSGAERAEVSAEFEAGRGALARWLEDNELAGDAGALLMRRVIDASGRSRGFINGHAATLAQLRDAGDFLVDIHGQHQHQSLGRSAAQRGLLDAFGGHSDTAGKVAELHRAWQQRRESRIAFEANAAAFGAEREQIEWQAREIEALKIGPDEWPELAAEHSRLAHAANLIEAAQAGVETLSEGENSGLAQLNAVVSRLHGLVEHDARLKEILELLDPARIQLQEAVYALRHYGERLDLDPQRLREVEARLDAIHTAARKYRVEPGGLPAKLEAAKARLREMGEGGSVEALRQQEDAAHAACVAEARKLSAARKKAAKKLSDQVTDAMQKLAMQGGRLEAGLNAVAEVTAHGLEDVEFLVAMHKGMAPQPLAKVASGGELSRLSLAVQAVASQVAQVPTLIFDEVDAGIGGRVAEIVGQMLKQLGARHQVMCITHLPQVAASADRQWQVDKSTANGKVSSRVTLLDPAQRVEEIARMLGGLKITETTRKHAAEMLKHSDR
ncbi:MAG: DNA repair protein RecN [Betaproteobacteria bacterium RIFCSPLOWO2_02_FULL_67_26]|nr:MAG: DNA repair protein RecN [Betaproteobacteria bacterium RIFCSPLOWO2_02_FULL_67_26]